MTPRARLGLVAATLCGVVVAAMGGALIARAFTPAAPQSTQDAFASMNAAAAELDHGDAIQTGYGIAAGVLNDLLALAAFGPDADVDALSTFAPGAAMTAETLTRDQIVDTLTQLGPELEAAAKRFVVPADQRSAVAVATTSLSSAMLQQLRDGPGRLDPKPYVATMRWLQEEVAHGRDRTDDARDVIARTHLAVTEASTNGAALALGVALVVAVLCLMVMLLFSALRTRALQRDAASDALTRAANRRQLEADIDARADQGVGVLMIDIDHFKRLNDSVGHAAGDAALRRVAATISSCLRTGDALYRYGGEEFCALLPGADEIAASAVAERIRAAIEAVRFEGEEHLPNGRLTVSIGLAVDAPRAGIGRADQALYDAKAGGRNRVVPAPAA